MIGTGIWAKAKIYTPSHECVSMALNETWEASEEIKPGEVQIQTIVPAGEKTTATFV